MADISQQIAGLIEGLNLSEAQISLLTRNLATIQQNALYALDGDVSRAKEGSRVTQRGFDLMAKAVAGAELRYTRMALGDSTVEGQMVSVSDEDCALLNGLINERMSIPIADVRFSGGGTFTVKACVQNANVTGNGFRAAELGLFAIDPDTGEEILYAYRNSGIASQWIPGGDGAVVWNIILTLITVIDSATNVTAVIDGNLAFVTQTELSEHVNSNDPHPTLPKRGDDITTATYVWATYDDQNIHRLSIENLQRLILGGDANTIPKVERRLGQVEVNVANLYMQLKAELDFGFRPNLMLVEDFENLNYCDMYNCRVIAQIAGVNGFQIESDKNILNGHWYTITDGINSEYVRVKSVAKNADNIVIILEGTLENTYNLDNTVLMRSTALIKENSAEGAGDLRGMTLNFNETWSGTGGNVASDLPLETVQSKANNFVIEGDGGFTAGGEFTLIA